MSRYLFRELPLYPRPHHQQEGVGTQAEIPQPPRIVGESFNYTKEKIIRIELLVYFKKFKGCL